MFSQCLFFLQVLLYSVDSPVSALDQNTGKDLVLRQPTPHQL